MSEMEKARLNAPARVAIMEFLDWLDAKAIRLAKYGDGQHLEMVTKSKVELVDEYFEVDPVKLEAERRLSLLDLLERVM